MIARLQIGADQQQVHPEITDSGGTGRYAGASGSEWITVEVLDAGATEAWSGAVYPRHKDEQ
jgi:hypothetical protein